MGPKVQRGISLARDLYDAIQADAEKYGKPWNEVAEAVLRRAFLPGSDLHNRAKSSRQRADEIVTVMED